jgi:hypothetical protein
VIRKHCLVTARDFSNFVIALTYAIESAFSCDLRCARSLLYSVADPVQLATAKRTGADAAAMGCTLHEAIIVHTTLYNAVV